MSEDSGDTGEYVILSEKPVDEGRGESENPLLVSGIHLITFTFIYMAVVALLPLGIPLEQISNFVLEFQDMTVGVGNRRFNVRDLAGIYSAGLFFFLSDFFRAAPKLISEHLPKRLTESIVWTKPHIWGNLMIFVIIVPVIVVGVTTFIASQLSVVEDLWSVMIAGYSGAIIGCYRQIASTMLPKY